MRATALASSRPPRRAAPEARARAERKRGKGEGDNEGKGEGNTGAVSKSQFAVASISFVMKGTVDFCNDCANDFSEGSSIVSGKMSVLTH